MVIPNLEFSHRDLAGSQKNHQLSFIYQFAAFIYFLVLIRLDFEELVKSRKTI